MEWRRWCYVLLLRFRSIFRYRRVEEELEEELRFHLECKVEDGMDRGLGADDAYIHALKAMGGLERRKEEIRDMRRVRWFTDLIADMRYALRMIGHSKLFAFLVVVTLGLGIGANSAIFSLADATLLRPLPVLRPSEIVTLSNSSPSSSSQSSGPFSYRDYIDYQNQSKSFNGLSASSFLTSFGFAHRRGELPKLRGGLFVSGNLLQTMGVEPALGRDFRPDEDQVPGRNAVVILGDKFWRSQFAGDTSVVGRQILLNGNGFTVIGVLPKKFTGLDQYVHPDVLIPIMMWPRLVPNPKHNPLEDRGDRELAVKGRLRPGVSLAQARAESRVIAEHLQREYPKTDRDRQITVRTEFESRVQVDVADALLTALLLALAGAVLLIACANVASLLLGRARTRSREIAIRLAIGAGRFRLLRLLLTESLLLAILGGVAGLALAYGGVQFFSGLEIPTDLPVSLSVELDKRVLLYNLTISLASAVLCGLAPALQTTRANLVTALKTADADVPGKRRLWSRNTLVICQVAASLALLTAASQMIRTFGERWRGGPGFRADHVFTMAFDPQLAHSSEEQTDRFYADLVRRTRQLPGVKSAALCGGLPMSNEQDGVSVIPEGFQMPAGRESFPVDMTVAGEGYFETFGVQLIRGRGFQESDNANAPKVAVVNEQFAKHYWPNRDALGKKFRLDNANGPLVQVVGISKTAKYEWIGESPTEFVYLPWRQRAESRMVLLAESKGPSDTLAEPLRELVRNLDAGQPVFNVWAIEDYYRRRVVNIPKMILQAVSTMGIIGLTLALAGLYGLVTYTVNRKTREIGIRMAVGADRGAVLRLVLLHALVLAVSGICVGLVLSAAMGRGLNAIFQSSGVDWGAYLLVLPALLVVTGVAAFIPALKASRIEPTRALRYE